MKEKLDILKYEAENGLVTYSEYIKQIIDFSEVSQALIQQIIQFNLLLEKITKENNIKSNRGVIFI